MKNINSILTVSLLAAIMIFAFSTVPDFGTRNAFAVDDIEAVNTVIDEFQAAYSAKNLGDVQKLFHYNAVVGIDYDNHTSQDIMIVSDWAKITREIFKSKLEISDKLTNRKIDVYRDSMATVVCDYNYRDNSNHQAGIDVFTLMKIKGRWKIISLIFSGDGVK
ncbi:MAG: nuclear transport factor 2 family protein [bacterium]